MGKGKFPYREVVELRNGSTVAKINSLNLQLFSLMYDGQEFMWGGGKPNNLKTEEEMQNWQNSEILMCPIIGASKNGKVTIDGVEYPMTKHGTARYMTGSLVEMQPEKNRDKTECSEHYSASFLQEYKTMQRVKTAGIESYFPFSYNLYKRYFLMKDGLEFSVSIENTSKVSFPYAIGFHPAFLISSKDCRIMSKSGDYTLDDVKKISEKGALDIDDNHVIFYSPKSKSVEIKSNFGRMKAWSPTGAKFMCIEPVTASSNPEYSGELSQKPGYRMLAPFSIDAYYTQIGLNWEG